MSDVFAEDTTILDKPWLTDPLYGGMSPESARRSWQAGQERKKSRSETAPQSRTIDPEELFQATEPPTKVEPINTRAASAKSDAVHLTYFNELTHAAPKPWLIKNVLARGETSSWIAPPGLGKSALLTDLAVHLAASQDWRNYRVKESAGVIYFALERADLVKRRLLAHKLRDGFDNLPIAVASQVLDLMHRNAPGLIVATVDAAEQRFGSEVGLCIVDTYAKAIAAGGGDESAAKDQNAALANLRRVLDQKNLHIASIGHTGKDATKGERGSNARLADVDLLVQLTGDTIKTATINKANDAQTGDITSFRLEPIDFGKDEDGEAFGVHIVSRELLCAATSVVGRRSLSERQQLALAALAEATLVKGISLPPKDGLPAGLKAITADDWRAELLRRCVLDPAAGNPRARFSELRTQLQAKHVIGVDGDLVWLAART